MTKEKFRTDKSVFDRFTVAQLRKLETEGFLEVDTLQPLFVGKESNVFIGQGKQGRVAVKIYRLETCDFLQMYHYLRADTRINTISRRRREVIFTWVRREFRNLMKAREFGVRVPTPYVVKNNIIVMELIGNPANKIKDDIPKDPATFYPQLMEELQKLLKAGIVHADLSKFNILNYDEEPVLIDFSQGTAKDAFHAKELFERDLFNINTFFEKIGQEELKSLKDFSW